MKAATATKKPSITSYMVTFANVGARHLSWHERITRPINEAAIIAAVRRKGALLSRDVEAPYVHDYSGTIYVGGVRPVGTYLIDPASGE